MKKSIFQKMWDAIEAWETPSWLKELLDILTILLRKGFKELVEAEVAYLKNAIIVQVLQTSLVQKNYRTSSTVLENDTRLHQSQTRYSTTIICSLVNMLKESGDIH